MRKKPTPSARLSAWDTAAAYGCDMSLIDNALRMSVRKRPRAHDRALNSILKLREARGSGAQEPESLVERLCAGRVDFVVVGGYAEAVHGVTPVTQEVAVCSSFDEANLMRLQKALDGLHPLHRMTPDRRPMILTKESCHGLKNLYLHTDLGQLDCLGEVKGVGPYSAVLEASEVLEMGPHACRILTIDALLAAKRAMARDRDREAVIQLEAIRERRARDKGAT